MLILIVSGMLSASFTFASVGAQEIEEELQDVNLFMHGDEETGYLNTSYGEYEEHHVLTTNLTDVPTTPIYLGEWRANPLVYPMVIHGEAYFILFARGNLQQVVFSAYITVNGLEITNEMSTEIPQDLTEDTTVMFISNVVNMTQTAELSDSDVIGFQLWMTHNDPNWYVPPPLGTGGKNVTLVMGGFSTASFVNFYTNSTHVVDIAGRDDPASGNMIVTALIKCSFGVEDFSYISVSTKSTYGNKFELLHQTIVDEATIEAEWEWEYSVSDGGSYPVTVRVRDRNFNAWERTEDIHITTPYTEVDFVIEDSDIAFSEDPKKDENVTVTAKIRGLGRRWISYQVEVEFFDGNIPIETVKTSISRGGVNTVSIVWVPEDDGNHAVSVYVDPDDDIDETDESNNEASTIIEVKRAGGTNGTPGFEPVLLLAAVLCSLVAAGKGRRGA